MEIQTLKKVLKLRKELEKKGHVVTEAEMTMPFLIFLDREKIKYKWKLTNNNKFKIEKL